MDRFAGKVVVITGAANGIGAAAARRFSSEGATVVLADCVEDNVMKMAATFPDDKTMTMVVDVSDPEAVRKMIEDTVRKYGKLDVMINNAGVHVVGWFWKPRWRTGAAFPVSISMASSMSPNSPCPI